MTAAAKSPKAHRSLYVESSWERLATIWVRQNRHDEGLLCEDRPLKPALGGQPIN